jgi:hypothetical protein
MEEMRQLLGVGTQLKEQKVTDNRPKKPAEGSLASPNPSANPNPGMNPSLQAVTGGSSNADPKLTRHSSEK